jgi:tryptophan synthase alpha chain
MTTYTVRKAAGESDSLFLYELKKLVLRVYVEQIWGWDEAVQLQYHAANYHPEQTHIIEIAGERVGTVEITEREKEIFICSLYLLPAYQGKSIGSGIIRSCLQQAAAQGKQVTLEVLRSNTGARKLYERLGFTAVPGKSDDLKIFMYKEGTMSRIQTLFQQKQQQVLNVYCTAGYPRLNSTLEVMKALQQNGVDLIELGIPYSDPLADGPVIQASSTVALANGMTIAVLFQQLENLRKEITVPVILMGYMNPVLQYGFERFCADAARLGVDGLILPDLPGYEFETEYAAIIRKYNLDFIFLVTPETADDRIKKLDELSSGFLYAVSSSSTTGKDKNLHDQDAYFKKLRSLQLKNPVLVGFGIKDKESFETACGYANGAIIGSAFIRALENAGDINAAVKKFIGSIR